MPPRKPIGKEAPLPKYFSTLNPPPLTDKYERNPTLGMTCSPTLSTAFGHTLKLFHHSTGSPSNVALISAPVKAITAFSSNTSVGPTPVISKPATPSSFPTNLFPIRNAKSSMGPDGGIPIRHLSLPILPGYSSISVYAPPCSTLSRTCSFFKSYILLLSYPFLVFCCR